jgi:hypothetical protein
MTHKTAYLWGPISSFSGPLVATLLNKGWQIHVATKSSLNLFTLSPLDLKSAAQTWIERALGGHDQLHIFQERLRFLDAGEIAKGVNYDAVIFCGLPPNFDEPRAPRAPWAAGELPAVAKLFTDVPTFIISSLWGGIQPDDVVPEELEFERRKPKSHWEGVCQQYEHRIMQNLSSLGSQWHLIRLPLLSGSTVDGSVLNFCGLSSLLRTLSLQTETATEENKTLKLSYNPDSTLWFSPVNTIVSLFSRLLEDESRPKICNLVSTQNILNREWVQHLAQALGYNDVEAAAEDPLTLPGILRKMLKDAVQVKTRNLFEVAGRYQHTPTLLDSAYFDRLIAFGKTENWGHTVTAKPQEISFSPELARTYFQEFMPAKISPDTIGEVTKGGAEIAFYIESAEPLSFILKAANGLPVVEALDPSKDHPRVSFHLSGDTMAKLVQNKLSLPKALLMREVRMDGPWLDAVRISNVLYGFLQNNPYAPDREESSNGTN